MSSDGTVTGTESTDSTSTHTYDISVSLDSEVICNPKKSTDWLVNNIDLRGAGASKNWPIITKTGHISRFATGIISKDPWRDKSRKGVIRFSK